MRKYIAYPLNRIKEDIKYFRIFREKTGIGFAEIYRTKFFNNINPSSLFGKRIKVPNAFWHMHSLSEIFIDEVYKFNASTTSPIILDCGSNVGLSIIYFKRMYPKSKVIGFEPDPEIFEMLKYNLAQFGYVDVEVINKAVWKNETTLSFNAIGALGGTLNFQSSVDTENNSRKINVQTVRLKNYLSKYKVDFLKIDIEGAEFEIIEDCLEELKSVENIFIELHRKTGENNGLGEFISKLESKGFTIYIKEAWNNLPHPFCYFDYNPMYDLQLNIFWLSKEMI